MGRDGDLTTLPRLAVQCATPGIPTKSSEWPQPAGAKSTHVATSKRRRLRASCPSSGASPKLPVQLSSLDQRVLVLYNSKRRRQAMALRQTDSSLSSSPAACAEAHHAARTIQRVVRGHRCRRALHAFFGPINQQKALLIQRIFRGHCGRQRIHQLRARQAFLQARKIQAWVRGVLTRDRLATEVVLDTIAKVQLLQRVVRGHWGRRKARQRRHDKHTASCLTIQRVYRGCRGRARVKRIRYENQANVRAMARSTQRHAVCTRCKGCSWAHGTEQSLLACTLVRLLGLYDLPGAAQLAQDGLDRFPQYSMFPLVMAIILQVQCASVEVAMVYLHKAKTLGLVDADLKQCEARSFFAALAWQPGNAFMCAAFAIYLQSVGLVKRAESFYKQALNANPLDYPLPTYLARRTFCDHIVVNFKRFLCLFKLPPALHVRLTQRVLTLPAVGTKTVRPTGSSTVTISVSRLNHFAVFVPDNGSVCNGLYISDDELSFLLHDASHGTATAHGDERPSTHTAIRGRRKAFLGVHQRRRTRGGRSSVAPKEQAMLHEAKTTVRLSTEQVETMLNQVVLVPAAAAPGSYVLLLPQLQRLRDHQTSALIHYEAAVNIQRVYRGHVVRSRRSRVLLFDRIRDDQVYQLQQLLHRRKFVRHERARAATTIQAVRRGCVSRRTLQDMAAAATKIQSLVRRELAKRRVDDIRQGNSLQFPVLRVHHRGVELQGKLLVLAIDQRGLSFRFTATDFAAACEYTGCCPRARTLQMLRHWNELYAAACVGRAMYHVGQYGKVAAIENPAAPELRLVCELDKHVVSLSLVETGLAIRSADKSTLRRSMGGCPGDGSSRATPLPTSPSNTEHPPMFPLPVDPAKSDQLVAALLPHIALVPTMAIPTRHMQSTSAAMALAVVVPPSTTPLFVPSLVPMKFSKRTKSQIPPVLSRQLPKPYQTKLRIDSSMQTRHRFTSSDVTHLPPARPPFDPGQPIYRKQCVRHFNRFSTCKCFLPMVPTPAHVAALEAALAIARPDHDLSRHTVLTNNIPNRSHRMWIYGKLR
ncbi:hypothetical protein H310_12973 [Aphanomyces invadans]|uniref:Uncharacterized protein n=1 Tax=Aphanomyces invadans TaxID=157072 RepID=A0A024TF00_9STRA|nr:hypothetical protein H310_12973 [Aphanomyces invadans]ETV92740.1 hypothetical protein H310_12973 [Aphanomyces invadans]|eukprot:XP_008878510.1 hypothetical protein H310_12973 [Aphanomyces invadans]